MEPSKYYHLSNDFSCSSNHYRDGDSWLHVLTKDYSLLNLNDCSCEFIEDSQSILNQLKAPVDVLFTQFGYANRLGNKDQIEIRKAASALKLKAIKIQNEVFKPKVIIPFASFVYFCHEDNKYMNDSINRIGNVYDFIKNEIGVTCNVLYPNDKWSLFQPYSSRNAIDNYNKDYLALEEKNGSKFILSKKIEREELIMKSIDFKNKILALNNNNLFIKLFTPVKIYIEDYDNSYTFDFKNGLREKVISKDYCDISINSDALLYCYSHLWGGDTLNINGRFQIPRKGNYSIVRQHFKLASSNNRGETYSTLNFIKSILKVKLKK